MIKHFLFAGIAALALAAPAQAEFVLPNVPAKFRGTWTSAEFKNDITTIIAAKSVVFGGGKGCNITKIVPAHEDGNSIEVAWKCPEYPNMLMVNVIWKLTKVGGQQVMMQINTDCGACSSILRRVR
jgi:hypothetical protein